MKNSPRWWERHGPRISLFMQRFHNLGLIETNKDRLLIIKEKKLTDYLAQIA